MYSSRFCFFPGAPAMMSVWQCMRLKYVFVLSMVLEVSARYIAGIVVRVALLFSVTDYLRLITQPLQRYLSASTLPLSTLPALAVSGSSTPATVSPTGCIIAVCARHGALGSQLHASPSPRITTSLQLPSSPHPSRRYFVHFLT